MKNFYLKNKSLDSSVANYIWPNWFKYFFINGKTCFKRWIAIGKWSPIIEEVAKFPGKVIYFFRSNTLKVDPQIAKTDFEKV